MKLSNIWKEWLSTLIGVLITATTAISTNYIDGNINWQAVAAVAVPAAILALTNLLQKLQDKLK